MNLFSLKNKLNYVYNIKNGHSLSISGKCYEDVLKHLDPNLQIDNFHTYEKCQVNPSKRLIRQGIIEEKFKDEIYQTKNQKSLILFWETNKWPKISSDIQKNYDQLIRPAKFLLEAEHYTDFPNKESHYLPLYDFFTKNRRPYFNNNSQIQFYTIAAVYERKNLIQTLRCFHKAFEHDQDVILKVRISCLGVNKLWNDAINFYKEKAGIQNSKNIVFVGNPSEPYEFIVNLHQSSDIFYLLQRSEGWGLPHFEAISCGNPVLSNNYSGVGDFMNHENSFIIPHQLKDTSIVYKNKEDIYKPFIQKCVYDFPGMKWAHMKDDDVIDLLRVAKNSFKEKDPKLNEEFKFENIVKKARQIFLK